MVKPFLAIFGKVLEGIGQSFNLWCIFFGFNVQVPMYVTVSIIPTYSMMFVRTVLKSLDAPLFGTLFIAVASKLFPCGANAYYL